MGIGWCKNKAPDDEVPHDASSSGITMSTEPRRKAVMSANASVVDELVLEMLPLIASFVNIDEESPSCLVKLHVIADSEDGWMQVVSSMVNVIPLANPFGPSAITILFDDCPLPTKESVIKVMELLQLSAERASRDNPDVRLERNICVVLGCIAEKLAGPNSIAVLTPSTLDYLLTFLIIRQEPRIVLFALIALEKFAHTTENKLTIKARLEREEVHPLVALEDYANDQEFTWRQVGFCAKWALDNLFVVEGRKLSYEEADMNGLNVILNSQDVSEYLKISSNGLEARCDSYSFESVRSTFQVDRGCWYYEATVVTSGVMQIGWATKNSHYLNHEGYGIGDDLFSLSYDGCRKLVWYKARASPVNVSEWQPGDVVGALIDLDKKEVVFSLNGERIALCKEIFDTTRCGFYAAASFMAFQQCRFNFGKEPFKFPPKDRVFTSFNDHGTLTDEEKKVVPRRVYLEQLRSLSVKSDSCTLCCDAKWNCVLQPCGHMGFCSVCTSQLKDCPMCRSKILYVYHGHT